MGVLISPINDVNQPTFLGMADTVFCIIIAHATLVALFISPAPTFWRMLKKGSTGEFHPFPYMISYAYWTLLEYYATVGQPQANQSYNLYLVYQFGCIFSILYIGIFGTLTELSTRLVMFLFGWIVTGPIIVMGIIHITTPYRISGPLCVFYGILMYASPLSVGPSYDTKRVEYLPFWPCTACFLNGLVWVIYSCVFPAFDVYVTITNGVGMLLGLWQLHLYYKYGIINIENSSTIHPVEDIEASHEDIEAVEITLAK